MRGIRIVALAIVVLAALASTDLATAASPPANDRISNAKTVKSPSSDSRSIAGATRTGDEPVGCIGKKSVWYKFTPPKTAAFTFSTFGSNFDTVMAVYGGSPSSSNQIVCVDNVSSRDKTSAATVAMQSGKVYYIAVSAWTTGADLKFAVSEGQRFQATVTKADVGGTASGPPGTTLSVAVEGYTTNKAFEIYYQRNGALKLFPGGSGYVGISGFGSQWIDIPQLPGGAYNLQIKERGGWLVKPAKMTVTARLSAGTSQASAGQSVRLFLRGFAANEVVKIQWWDGARWKTAVMSINTNADGSAEKSLIIKDWMPTGTAQWRATGSKTQVNGDPIQISGVSLSSEKPATPTVTPTPLTPATPVVAETPVPTETPEIEPTATVANQAPVANAGPDQVVTDADLTGGEPIALDGTASADPEGAALAYSWSENGVEIAIGPNPVIELAVGTHELLLTVTDDLGLTATDTVLIVIEPGSSPTGEGTPAPSDG